MIELKWIGRKYTMFIFSCGVALLGLLSAILDYKWFNIATLLSIVALLYANYNLLFIFASESY